MFSCINFVAIISLCYLILALYVVLKTGKGLQLTTFHFFLAINTVNLVVRPFLSSLNGYWTLHTKTSPEGYTFIVFLVFSFSVCLLLGYYISFIIEKKTPSLNCFNVEKSCASANHLNVSPYYFLIVVSFLYLFSFYGLSWLGPFRTEAASNVAPEFRLIYPIVVFCSFALAVSSFINYQRKNIKGFSLILSLLFILFAMVLLNTRGWFVSIVTLLVCMYFRFNRPSVRILISAAGLVFFAAFYMRSLISAFIQQFSEAEIESSSSENHSVYDSILEMFLYNPSGDTIDTWVVIVDYVNEYGLTYGASALASFFLLLPSFVRESFGLWPTLDLINFYYYGPIYRELNFGFNVNFSQDMFVNFGYFSYFFIFLSGYFWRVIDVKILNRPMRNEYDVLYVVFIYQFVSFFISTAAVSWVVTFFLFFIFYLIVKAFLKIKIVRVG